MNTIYTIGKLATLSKVTIDTLRHYEKIGLIAPVSKTSAGYRLYNDAAVDCVRFIKKAQSYGFLLSDVRKLLALKNEGRCCCEDVRNIAFEKKLRIRHKLVELESMLQALDKLIENCNGDDSSIESCPILGKLEIRRKRDK